MRRAIYYLIIIVFLTAPVLNGQVAANETPAVLEKLYGRLVGNFNDNDRQRVNDSIISIIGSYVKSDTVFSHSFGNLRRYLGQKTSPDSLLKIVTWNLVLRNSPSRYYCYIIRKQTPGRKNRIYSLITDYNEKQIKTDTIYNASDWYGALYYDIQPIIVNHLESWILLGIDYGNSLISRKIIDVLSFTESDSVIFGKKWFDGVDKLKFREVFEYASNGTMSLRLGSDSTIVFDHLVPFSPSLKDDRQYYGPDYSYDAYSFENGIWKLKINIDVRNKE